ncbi:MAG: hypothetical protein Q8S75_05205, partial [Nitrospirota bacterium]|nr:hypothetical protein [Nitrospirota bacterium]
HDRTTHLVIGGSDEPSFSAFIICICYHAATRTGLSADNHIADFQDLSKLSAALRKEAAAMDALSFTPRGIPRVPSFDWNT